MKKPTAPDDTSSINPIRVTERERQAWRLAVKEGDTIPEGWRISRDWATIWEVKKSKANETIACLIGKGKMQSRRFLIRDHASGYKLMSIAHYKLI